MTVLLPERRARAVSRPGPSERSDAGAGKLLGGLPGALWLTLPGRLLALALALPAALPGRGVGPVAAGGAAAAQAQADRPGQKSRRRRPGGLEQPQHLPGTAGLALQARDVARLLVYVEPVFHAVHAAHRPDGGEEAVHLVGEDRPTQRHPAVVGRHL